MAIDTGFLISPADLQAVGGIRQILVCEYTNITGITPTSPNGDHTITGIADTNPLARFEFKNETASMSIAGSTENGSTVYEVSLAFFVPNMSSAQFKRLKMLTQVDENDLTPETQPCVAVVEMNSGKKFVVGLSYAHGGLTGIGNKQAYATLTSLEGGSGDAYSSDNGVTVTIMARQFELPYEYTGTITIAGSGSTATLS